MHWTSGRRKARTRKPVLSPALPVLSVFFLLSLWLPGATGQDSRNGRIFLTPGTYIGFPLDGDAPPAPDAPYVLSRASDTPSSVPGDYGVDVDPAPTFVIADPPAACSFSFAVEGPARMSGQRALHVQVTADFTPSIPYRDPGRAIRQTHSDQLFAVNASLSLPSRSALAEPDFVNSFTSRGSRHAQSVIIGPATEERLSSFIAADSWWYGSDVNVEVSTCGILWPSWKVAAGMNDTVAPRGNLTISARWIAGASPVPGWSGAPVVRPTRPSASTAGYCLEVEPPARCDYLSATIRFAVIDRENVTNVNPRMTFPDELEARTSEVIFQGADAKSRFDQRFRDLCRMRVSFAQCLYVDVTREDLSPFLFVIALSLNDSHPPESFTQDKGGNATSYYSVVLTDPLAFGRFFDRDTMVVNGSVVPTLPPSQEPGPLVPTTEAPDFPRFAVVLLVFGFFAAILFVIFACLKGRGNSGIDDDIDQIQRMAAANAGDVPDLAASIAPQPSATFATVEIRLPSKSRNGPATPSQNAVPPREIAGNAAPVSGANDLADALGQEPRRRGSSDDSSGS